MRTWARAVAIVIGLALAVFVAMLGYDALATRGTASVHDGLYYAENLPYAPPSPPPCANSSRSLLTPLFSTSFHGILFAFAYGTVCPSGDPALQAVGTESSGQIRVHTFFRPRPGDAWFSPDGAFGARLGIDAMTLYSRFSGFLFFPQLHLAVLPSVVVGWGRLAPPGGAARRWPETGGPPRLVLAPRTRAAGFRGLPR